MDVIIYNIGELVTCQSKEPKKGVQMMDLSIRRGVAIYIKNGIFYDIDEENTILKKYPLAKKVDAKKKSILPGFIDSHTHLTFGGYREDEFYKRLNGVSYEDIMKENGGIINTVLKTREISKENLISKTLSFLKSMMMQGVTTLEGKSGYGLDFETEIKQLDAMKELELIQPLEIVRTYMGAHAIPSEMPKEEYIDFMTKKVMPYIKKNDLAEFVDVFLEKGAYSYEETRKILEEAKKQGFLMKMHADELSDMNGAFLGGELKVISCDHLLSSSLNGIKKMADNNVIATLLPLTAFNMKKEYANARLFIDNNVAINLASDFNPGSSFSENISLIFILAPLYMNMKIEEVINALTINAAFAINRGDKIGSIEINKQADFIILDYESYKFLPYHFGISCINKVYKKGLEVYSKGE